VTNSGEVWNLIARKIAAMDIEQLPEVLDGIEVIPGDPPMCAINGDAAIRLLELKARLEDELP
jgi:hypothetical protein